MSEIHDQITVKKIEQYSSGAGRLFDVLNPEMRWIEMEEAAGLYKLDLIEMSDIQEKLLVEQINRGIVLYDSGGQS